MNIVAAMERALTGQKIKRLSKDEWLVVTDAGSELRWVSNRQRAHLTVADVMANDWISEEDIVTISRYQAEEAYTIVINPDKGEEKKEEFFKHLGFKW